MFWVPNVNNSPSSIMSHTADIFRCTSLDTSLDEIVFVLIYILDTFNNILMFSVLEFK